MVLRLWPSPCGKFRASPVSVEEPVPSFDVVSKVNIQEIRNAVDQTWRELRTRFDFKGVDAGLNLEENSVLLWAEEEFQLDQLSDILKTKLAGRNVDVRLLLPEKIEAHGKQKRQRFRIVVGVDRDACRQIVKIIKDSKLKLQSQIQGDQVRVSGKKRDDLQQAIARLKEENLNVPLQFSNFRD